MSDVIDEHRHYLDDPIRLDAYERAIRELVTEDDVVIDLGCGTGILGLFAARAGAKRVYAIESTSLIESARAIAAANGFSDRIHHIKASSTRAELPEKGTLVVCDQIGRFGFDAGVLEYFADASKRLLVPDAKRIPGRLTLCLAPVHHPQRRRDVDFWRQRQRDFDVSPLIEIADNSGYPTQLERDDLLGGEVRLPAIDSDQAAPISAQVELSIEREGLLSGLGGWFRAELAPGIELTTSPLATDRIHRRNTFLPIGDSVPVKPGDSIRVAMHIVPPQHLLAWNVEVRAGGKTHRFSQSTFNGMLVAREDLAKQKPQFVPVLTRRAQARRAVLVGADGQRTVADIESEITSSFVDLFPTAGQASAFVAAELMNNSKETS